MNTIITHKKNLASEDFALLLKRKKKKTKTLKIYFQTFTKLETSWDIYTLGIGRY